jgi:hypothetical protein
METISQQIAVWALAQIGSIKLTELRCEAWTISQDNSQPEEVRRVAYLIDEAHERDLEAREERDELERAAENERYDCQMLAWAA